MSEFSPPAPPDGPIDPALVAAYRATDYVVDAPDGEIVLRVDAASEPLAALMRALRTPTAALLTAHNPWSLATAADANAAAQTALEDELSARAIPMLPAEGRDPTGAWPPESSVLAFGLSREAAASLARRYGQNGFVWVGTRGGVCELVLTRPVGPG